MIVNYKATGAYMASSTLKAVVQHSSKRIIMHLIEPSINVHTFTARLAASPLLYCLYYVTA